MRVYGFPRSKFLIALAGAYFYISSSKYFRLRKNYYLKETGLRRKYIEFFKVLLTLQNAEKIWIAYVMNSIVNI